MDGEFVERRRHEIAGVRDTCGSGRSPDPRCAGRTGMLSCRLATSWQEPPHGSCWTCSGYLDRPYVEYVGDVADGEVSAASPVETGHIVCSGVRFDYAAAARPGALLEGRSLAHG